MITLSFLEFWVVNASSIPFFTYQLGKRRGNQHLLGSFLSVLSIFTKELGEGKIKSIFLANSNYYFKEKAGLLFIMKTSHAFHIYEDILTSVANLILLLLPPEHIAILQRENIISLPEHARKILQEIVNQFFINLLQSSLPENWKQNLKSLDPFILSCRFNELIDIIDHMITEYPRRTIYHYRRLLRDHSFQHPHTLYQCGLIVGDELKKMLHPRKNILSPVETKKILDPLMICNLNRRKNSFIIELCPFCRGMRSSSTICSFLAGMIEGIINDPTSIVVEKQCKAKGDSKCIFLLEKHQ